MRYSDLMKLDIEVLTALYDREFLELKTALINGTDWNDIRDQKNKVTRIAISIHKKLNRNDSSDPSAFASRDH